VDICRFYRIDILDGPAMKGYIKAIFVFFTILVASCGGGSGSGNGSKDSQSSPLQPANTEATVLAFNDLGMHCMDREFSVFSILPPFNVVNAQVILRDPVGRPYLVDDVDANVFYDAKADPSGSINTYSYSNNQSKTDFWLYADNLFGVNLQNGEGLAGLFMPDDDPQSRGPQPVEYNLQKEWFSAEGIPITPIDDTLRTNTYSLMRLSAHDPQSGDEIGHLDVVVPVAAETDCQNCHRTGAIAASDPGINWSNAGDLEIQSKLNILKLHDAEHPAYDLEASQPVLCAQCHYSPALDLSGSGPTGDQIGKPIFSRVMHNFHGQIEQNGSPLFDPNAPVEQTCYQCHPGKITQCQRGAMKTGGMECYACHLDMLAVGAEYPLLADGSIDGSNDGGLRRPWLDLPRCQSCHTGDAVSHLTGNDLVFSSSGIRLEQAYRIGDPSASPILATNKRFAENTNSLFRNSKGHGGIGCEGCHGSTHAIWPNADNGANDNIAAKYQQGFAGTIIECGVCHRNASLPLTTNGPHGMHNVNDNRWIDENHGDFYQQNKDGCRACHGLTLTGTVLSRTPVARTFSVEEGTIRLTSGQVVRCNLCHEMPN